MEVDESGKGYVIYQRGKIPSKKVRIFGIISNLALFFPIISIFVPPYSFLWLLSCIWPFYYLYFIILSVRGRLITKLEFSDLDNVLQVYCIEKIYSKSKYKIPYEDLNYELGQRLDAGLRFGLTLTLKNKSNYIAEIRFHPFGKWKIPDSDKIKIKLDKIKLDQLNRL